MAKLADIEGVTTRADFVYADIPVMLRVRCNFLTPEMEVRLTQLSGTEQTDIESVRARNTEFAEILSGLVASWDIEDAQPVPETFTRLGITFMAQAAQAALEAVVPGKAPGTP